MEENRAEYDKLTQILLTLELLDKEVKEIRDLVQKENDILSRFF